MDADYWRLGEDVQDSIRAAGYEHPTVEGIAVDLHDVLQAADLIRDQILPRLLAAETVEARTQALQDLRFEFHHLGWHCENATQFLDAAIPGLESL